MLQIGALLFICIALYFILPASQNISRQIHNEEATKATNTKALSSRTLPRAEIDVVRYDRKSTDDGVILLPISGTEEVLLISRDGKILHRWDGIDAARARLQDDCSLLVVHGSKWGLKFEKWHQMKKKLTLYDRDGKELRTYLGDDDIHHDAHLLKNGNLLFLELRQIPYPEVFPDRPEEKDAVIRSDAVYEVTPQNEKAYSWFASDHLDMRDCGWNGCEKRRKVKEERSHIWDWTHVNTVSPLPSNKHFANGDTRFRPGNFFIMPRNFWTAYLIEKESGKVVWEYSGEGKGKNFHTRLVRGHEVHMIPEGYPGAGNILVFDNGLDRIRNYSRILEVDPVTKKTVWEYQDRDKFYSRGAGSVQRLKNGNTLISEDMRGRVFEITPGKEIVWEIQTKFRVSRAHKYETNFCSAP